MNFLFNFTHSPLAFFVMLAVASLVMLSIALRRLWRLRQDRPDWAHFVAGCVAAIVLLLVIIGMFAVIVAKGVQ